jgi:hypothetical protein
VEKNLLPEAHRLSPLGLRLWRRVISLLIGLGLGFIFLILLTSSESLVERFFIFFPTKDLEYTPQHLGLGFQEIFFTTPDGLKLHSWYIPAGDQAPVLLWCHGNGGNISHRVPIIKELHQAGLGVFIFDYRGYGLSQGRASEVGVYQDAQAAYQYLRDSLGVPPGRIVLWGRSLGGVIAAELATKVPVRALILESTFTHVGDMARYHYAWLPTRSLWAQKFNLAQKIQGIKAPKLIVHGDQDNVVPLWMGEKIYSLALPPKEFYRIHGAGHNDVFELGGLPYLKKLKSFIQGSP